MPSAESQKIGRPSKDQAIHFSAMLVMNCHGLRTMSKEAMDFWTKEAGPAAIYAANALEREYIRQRGFELYQDPDQRSTYVNCKSFLATLGESGLLERCFGTEDLLIQKWIKREEPYPAELRGIRVYLWKSASEENVPYLVWFDGPISGLKPLSSDVSHLDYALVKT